MRRPRQPSPPVAPARISICHQLSAFARSTSSGSTSTSRCRSSPRMMSHTSSSYTRAFSSKPYGPSALCACPWSALAMNATRRPEASAARAIARPASTCAVAGRSLALHALAGGDRELLLAWPACLLDGHPAVGRDGREHEAHGAHCPLSRLARRARVRTVNEVSPLRLTEYSHGAG